MKESGSFLESYNTDQRPGHDDVVDQSTQICLDDSQELLYIVSIPILATLWLPIAQSTGFPMPSIASI